MDPASAAGSFATLVGLMANFASGRASGKSLEFQQFLEWLVVNGHANIRSMVEANHATTVSVKAALAEGRAELLQRLDVLEKSLVALAQGSGAVGNIATSMYASPVVSAQALALLVAFERLEAGKALVYDSFEHTEVTFIDGARNGSFTPSEGRFLKADIASLHALGLLSTHHSSKGTLVLELTRAGSAVANQELVRLASGNEI